MQESHSHDVAVCVWWVFCVTKVQGFEVSLLWEDGSRCLNSVSCVHTRLRLPDFCGHVIGSLHPWDLRERWLRNILRRDSPFHRWFGQIKCLSKLVMSSHTVCKRAQNGWFRLPVLEVLRHLCGKTTTAATTALALRQDMGLIQVLWISQWKGQTDMPRTLVSKR